MKNDARKLAIEFVYENLGTPADRTSFFMKEGKALSNFKDEIDNALKVIGSGKPFSKFRNLGERVYNFNNSLENINLWSREESYQFLLRQANYKSCWTITDSGVPNLKAVAWLNYFNNPEDEYEDEVSQTWVGFYNEMFSTKNNK